MLLKKIKLKGLIFTYVEYFTFMSLGLLKNISSFIYVKITELLYGLFQIILPHRLLQDIKNSSLCCIVGPCYLSILYIISVNPKFLIYPSPLSLLVTVSLFSMFVRLFLFCK